MQAIAALMLSLVVTGPTATQQSSRAGIVELDYCELLTIREAQIPARQPGVLEVFDLLEGHMVNEGDILAQIDDRDAQLRRDVASREYEAAAEQARENIEAEAARAAQAVAEAEKADSEYANRIAPNSIPPTEVRRQQLMAERSGLQVQVAEMEFAVAGLTAAAQRAKVDVIEHELKVRKVVAPFAGLVVERYRHEGEWVQAGDPVLRLIQMDKLYVQGMISAQRFAPYEIEGRPVRITVFLPGGQQRVVEGVIVYVSQVVEGSNEYRVRAEVENAIVRSSDNRTFWLLNPGMRARMTIDVTDLGNR